MKFPEAKGYHEVDRLAKMKHSNSTVIQPVHLHLTAPDNATLLVDPLDERTVHLHTWFQSSHMKNDGIEDEVDATSNRINQTLILPRVSDNLMPESDLYPMDTTPRGQALIININEFDNEPHKKRFGSEKDME